MTAKPRMTEIKTERKLNSSMSQEKWESAIDRMVQSISFPFRGRSAQKGAFSLEAAN